jgi:ribose-phosphate pyrophosphokinase|tara:strand:+ start:1332 stop:2267 length:936 start_codon:yes stop_codon:yes gene_type:complete
MKLIAGSSNQNLAEAIAHRCGQSLCEVELIKFADNELSCMIKENVRGEDVFIIQSICNPANDNLMELLILMDACKRASAGRITAVIPYFGYARQDRKPVSRTPITARLVANMLEAAGANRIVTMDLHAGQIQGFFDIPVDDLGAMPLFVNDLETHPNRMVIARNGVIVSPDAGGVARARKVAKKLHLDIAIIDKRREQANQIASMNVIGNVNKKKCIIVDDIVDTGGTLIKAAEALKKDGAIEVSAYITHGVLSKNGGRKMEESDALSNLVITDTIPNLETSSVKILTIAPMFAEAIRRINHNESISILFE